MSSLQLHPWLPITIAAIVAVLTILIRCITLLAGLLAVISKADRADVSHIFREFARATYNKRPPSADAQSHVKP
jgi:hypothetical protein